MKNSSVSKRIKVRLDYKTIIFVKSKASLKVWRERYPNLEIIG